MFQKLQVFQWKQYEIEKQCKNPGFSPFQSICVSFWVTSLSWYLGDLALICPRSKEVKDRWHSTLKTNQIIYQNSFSGSTIYQVEKIKPQDPSFSPYFGSWTHRFSLWIHHPTQVGGRGRFWFGIGSEGSCRWRFWSQLWCSSLWVESWHLYEARSHWTPLHCHGYHSFRCRIYKKSVKY